MLALLASGQGRQSPTMFRLVATEPAAQPIFAAAAALLNTDPRDLVTSADPQTLQINRTAQILCVTLGLALAACLDGLLPRRLVCAGYSVGAMTAWSIAGAWDAAATLRLVAERARLMDVADRHGGLCHVRGLACGVVERLAESHCCAVAIDNPDQVFVIGGDRDRLPEFCRAAQAHGAIAADLLPISVASHTHYLNGAVAPFLTALRAEPSSRFASGRLLFDGSGGRPILTPATGLDTLACHLAARFDWSGCLNQLWERGVTAALDLGPGEALARMIGTSAPRGIVSVAADQFASLSGVRAWVVHAATVSPYT